MKENKYIERDGQEATKIFDNRKLEVDYRTLMPLLKEGMIVLDVGCGTGAISKDIANIVGRTGRVVGIDNTEKFYFENNESNLPRRIATREAFLNAMSLDIAMGGSWNSPGYDIRVESQISNKASMTTGFRVLLEMLE